MSATSMPLFLAFVAALSITAATMPLLMRLAPRIGLTDRPGPRKVHTTSVPRVGGIGMAIGTLAATLLFVPMSTPLAGLLTGCAVVFLFGVLDDRFELGYRAKFAGQILAAVVCIAIGQLRVGALSMAGFTTLPETVGIALTFMFLVGVTNAVNLSDGLDGLAGGMSLLCFAAIAVLASVGGNGSLVAFALVVCGAILGFLRFNTHPARVFMGDAGSQTLGFAMGGLAIVVSQGESTPLSAALPLLLIGVPIIDTLYVMCVRLRDGRSPFSSDRNHLHHRFLELGFSHRESVSIVYLVQAAFFLAAYFLRYESDWAVISCFVGVAFLLLTALSIAKSRRWRAQQLRELPLARSVLKLVRLAPRSALVQSAPLWIMSAGIILYAALILVLARQVDRDVGMLCLAFLILLGLNLAAGRSRPLGWPERLAGYVGLVLLVYLDQSAVDHSGLLTALSWGLVVVVGMAAAFHYFLVADKNFEVTALDILIVFIAVVIPNLPGPSLLPGVLSAGIAKSIVLLYAIEIVLDANVRILVPRTIIAIAMSAIAVRGLLPAL